MKTEKEIKQEIYDLKTEAGVNLKDWDTEMIKEFVIKLETLEWVLNK